MGLTFNLGRDSAAVTSDASLNVGIGGAPSGSYKFEVTGTAKVSGAATFSSSVTANNTISAYYGSITGGNTPATSGTTPVNPMLNLTNNRGIGMYFGGKYSGDYAQWIQVSDVGNLGVNYPLLLNPNGGSVGIGTSSPSYLLHLYKNSEPELCLQNSTAIWRTGINSSSEYFIYTSNSYAMYFATNGSERMRITSGGNVGIGTSTTNTLLNINIPASSTNGLSLIDAGTVPVVFTYSSVTGENRIGGLLSYVFPTFYSGGSERMRITSGGNVGIGTSSPVTAGGAYVGLNISGATGSSLVLTSGANQTYLYAINGSSDFAIENAGAQIFRAGSAERMRITSGGNVLIGTTTDNGQKFQVSGNVLMSSGYNNFQQSTKTTTSGANLTFGMGSDYGQNTINDNVGGLVIINVNEANTNISLGNGVWIGTVINPRGTGATVTQISKTLGGGITALNVATSGNSIVVSATTSDGGNYRASMTFIGGAGTS